MTDVDVLFPPTCQVCGTRANVWVGSEPDQPQPEQCQSYCWPCFMSKRGD